MDKHTSIKETLKTLFNKVSKAKAKVTGYVIVFTFVFGSTGMSFKSMLNVSDLKEGLSKSVLNSEQIIVKPKETTTDSIVRALLLFGLKSNTHRQAYAVSIYTSCKVFKVDWLWVASILKQETPRFNPAAISYMATKLKGDAKKEFAYGLMQIKRSTGKDCAEALGDKYSDALLYDGPTSIRWGTYYLAQRLVSQEYNIERAVRAYTLGDAGLSRGYDSDNYWDRISANHALLLQYFRDS